MTEDYEEGRDVLCISQKGLTKPLLRCILHQQGRGGKPLLADRIKAWRASPNW
jgi:hypothetical protein